MRNNVVGRTSRAWKWGAAAAILFSQPVLSQGTMGPGAVGGSMAPQPRAAPAPVQTPQAPIVPTPSISSPALPITGVPTGSPDRAGKISDNQSPLPTDRSIPVATPAVPQPNVPATGRPQALPATRRTDGKTDSTPAIFDRWGRSPAIFDRWGSSFAPSRSFAPIPRAAVVSSQDGNSSVAQTQTNDKGIFTVGTGQAGPASYPVTSITISLPANPDARTVGTDPSAPAVLMGLALPVTPGSRAEVGHVFPRSALGRPVNIKVTFPRGGGDTTVDWGDGSPSTSIREGKPIGGAPMTASDPQSVVGVVNLLRP